MDRRLLLSKSMLSATPNEDAKPLSDENAANTNRERSFMVGQVKGVYHLRFTCVKLIVLLLFLMAAMIEARVICE